MDEPSGVTFGGLSLNDQEMIDSVCDAFETAWNGPTRPTLASFLGSCEDGRLASALFRELLRIEIDARRRLGDAISEDSYCEVFPQFRETIASCFGDTIHAAVTPRNHPGAIDTSALAPKSSSAILSPRRAALGRRRERFPIHFGDYDLLSRLGEGGMGVVYEARERKLDRLVALKIILPGANIDERTVRYFRNEAQAAAQLDHAGIVPVYEVGDCDGYLYYTMALVKGKSLRERVQENPLPPQEAAAILKQVAVAVHAAHTSGIVHRDLKPHNILLDQEGRPRVADFGLAKRMQEESQQSLDRPVGTPSYMSPEQAQGRFAAVGPVSDIYSLGATLYELVCGRPPFRAATVADTLHQVVFDEPVQPRQLNPAVPLDLETVTLKCLSKNPEARYASAQELADDLARFLAGHPVKARPISSLERAWRWSRRNRLSAALVGALALALIAGTISSLAFALRSLRNEKRAELSQREAEMNFDTAINFVNASVPATNARSDALLDAARDEYRKRLAREPGNLKSLDALARAASRAAESYRQAGRTQQTVDAAKEAVEVTRRKFEITRGINDEFALAHRLEYLGIVDAAADHEALQYEADEIRSRLQAEAADTEGLAFALFLSHFNSAVDQFAAQQWQRALETINRGLEHGEAARKANVDNDLAWKRIEDGYALRAEVLNNMGNREDSRGVIHESIDRLRTFIHVHPDTIQVRSALAAAENRLFLLSESLDPAAAARVLDIQREIVAARLKEPAWRDTLLGLADAYYNAGRERCESHRYKDAADELRQAEAMCRLWPDDAAMPPAVRNRWAETLSCLADAEAGVAEFTAAVGHKQQAIELVLQLSQNAPQNFDFLAAIPQLRVELAKIYEQSGQVEPELMNLVSAAEVFERIAGLDYRQATNNLIGDLWQPLCRYNSAACYARAYSRLTANRDQLPGTWSGRLSELRTKAIEGLRIALVHGFDDVAAKAAGLEGVAGIVKDEDWSALKDDPEVLRRLHSN